MLNQFDGSNCVTVNLVQKKKEKGIVDRLLCGKENEIEKWDLWYVV